MERNPTMNLQNVFISCAILVLTSTCSASAAAPVVTDDVLREAQAIRERALQANDAWRIVEELTQKIGPRLAGSAGDKAAVAWAGDMLSGLGLANVRREPVEVPHWDRGSLSVRIDSSYPQPLTATSLGGSQGTAEEGLSAQVVRFASVDELREAGSDTLAGKIAFVDKVMKRHRDGSGYGENVIARGCGPELAANRGAVAAVIRSVGTSVHRMPHTGGMSIGGKTAGIPAIALANADADILAYQLSLGEPVSLSVHSTARDLPPEMSANVIGEIPGSDKADEIVILGAHLDSWDLGTGAIDDGAGVAIVSAAAKILLDAGVKPRRTIRVVLFANEEFGLSGALAYAKAHAGRIDNHVLGMEADFGAGAVWQVSSGVAESALPVIDVLHQLLAPLGIERGDNESRGGADLMPLRAAGMPVLGLNQDGTHYFDYHHTPDDTLDKIDPAALTQNVAAYAVSAYVAAMTDEDFGRLDVAGSGGWSRDCEKQPGEH
jgi:Zn-dependent M28 family amino/carboxypeptidase